jgi:hypothetical protein
MSSGIEQKAERAYELERAVVVGSLSARRAWIEMAAALHAIRAEGLYELLGYEKFTDWIATPEVSLKRTQAYALTSIYEELVIERRVPLDDLYYLEPTKVSEVLPAIRGGLDVVEALADAAQLSRSDLRAKYRGVEPSPEEPVDLPVCPECGQLVKSVEAKGKAA